jgi:hypothetical protein
MTGTELMDVGVIVAAMVGCIIIGIVLNDWLP